MRIDVHESVRRVLYGCWQFDKGFFSCSIIISQLRARRALLQLKDVPLRTRWALLLYKVNGNSALLVLNGTSLICNSALLALSWLYYIQCLPFNFWLLTSEHMRIHYIGNLCIEGAIGSCIPLDFPTNFGQKASTIRAKSLDFRASGGENIRARYLSPPPPPERNWYRTPIVLRDDVLIIDVGCIVEIMDIRKIIV